MLLVEYDATSASCYPIDRPGLNKLERVQVVLSGVLNSLNEYIIRPLQAARLNAGPTTSTNIRRGL
jgi:hypothetical protein